MHVMVVLFHREPDESVMSQFTLCSAIINVDSASTFYEHCTQHVKSVTLSQERLSTNIH